MVKLLFDNMTQLFGGLVRKGVAIGYGNGDYLIVIDESLNKREQLDVLKHEIAHILMGHCDSDCDDEEREQREKDAEEYAYQMTDKTLSELVSGLIGETIYR